MTGKRPEILRDLPPFPIGIQYYRQPTPLPDEWDGDLAAVRAMGFDLVQLRPQWRWHERNEGELDFSDLDALFDLTQKHGLGVLLKFYLPTAPEWLFDRYDALRVTPTGEAMRPATDGSVYIGGFTPCFDKDLVREKAAGFVRAVVQRYRARPNLLAWNAWNEPRSRPAVDCACAESLAKYREWLRRRFGTIEALNRFAGLAVSGKGADFSGVKAPVTYNDYLGWFLFRTWRAEMVADRLKWMYALIRQGDADHPVITHVGFCSALQDALEDTSCDWLNARQVDLYGSSCPNRSDDLPSLEHLPKAHEAATVDLICAGLRGLGRPFWVNEIYGNRGMYVGPLPPSYLRQATYGAVAGGAKGLVYWQFRSERLTTESNDAGLVAVSGEPTDRSREVARVVAVLKKSAADLAAAEPAPAAVGILYDFASDLISRIETAAPGPVRVEQGWREHYPYKDSLRGIHLALWELDVQADLVPSEEPDRLARYPVVYLPCPRMVSEEQAAALVRYVEAGGLLISEPSPGMRQANAWVSPHVPPKPLDELFGYREALRVRTREERLLATEHGTVSCPAGLFLAVLDVAQPAQSLSLSGRGLAEGETLLGGIDVGPSPSPLPDGERDDRARASQRIMGRWEDGGAAIVVARRGAGRAILLGAPLGEVYFWTRSPAILDWLAAELTSSRAGSASRASEDAHSSTRLREESASSDAGSCPCASEDAHSSPGRQEDLRVRRLTGGDGAQIVFIFNYRQAPARAAIPARCVAPVAGNRCPPALLQISELSDLGLTFERAGGCFVTEMPPEEVLIVKLSPSASP